ncbi:MAG: transketolase [Verrucomicrobiales bacterium]|jgi:transketolase|nr:transketolase [Verrucomicrobiales bacterium]
MKEILAEAANNARGLAIDAIHKCSSGHLGLPLGAAEIGAVLYGQSLQYNPADPKWINRDRFILSAGHGSMFLYSWLHLSGHDLPLEEVINFRQLGSKTPGHPEFGETPGVEATTGPLGQGIGNAVGYAVSGKMAASRFNTESHTIIDHHIFALAGDGCLQEGVAAEAAAFAGHFNLDNLILLYDSNDVTLDAMAVKTQTEDTGARFEAMGWDTNTIDGHDLDAINEAIAKAKSDDNGKPKLIICKTEIGRGIPEVAGTAAGHGEGGAKFAESARSGLGLPEEIFHVSESVSSYFTEHAKGLAEKYDEWNIKFNEWSSANPEKAQLLSDGISGRVPENLMGLVPAFDPGTKLATRAAGGEVLQPIAEAMPMLVSGSADLYGSTKNYIKSATDFEPQNDSPEGRNIWFGIREHGMGSIMNGIAYDGIFRASGATFAVFADYLRPSIRLAALAHLPTIYIFTHDSVGVGEDGPTHQPVETVSGLRVIPGLDVIRPADTEETAAAFVGALQRGDGPTALMLTRQGIPNMDEISAEERRSGTLRGGYIAKKEEGDLTTILLASGSEVQHAMIAAEKIGDGVRVVSMPCFERFDREPKEYREEILPSSCTKRIAIEAGVSGLWWKYVGDKGKVIGIDRFGISAPGGTVMTELSMTPEALIEAAQ